MVDEPERVSGWRRMLRLITGFVQLLQTAMSIERSEETPCLASHWRSSKAQHRTLLGLSFLRHTSIQRGTGVLDGRNIPLEVEEVAAPFDEYW